MQFITSRRVFPMLLVALSLLIAPVSADDNSTSGVILLYHHVAENTPRSTSLTPQEFSSHLEYIAANHTVVPLSDIVDAIQNKSSLPEKAVAITFDDGYENILTNAHPLLREHGFPYTIFINPDVIGVQGNQLDWEQVAAMQKEGVTFANHTLDHLHMLEKLEGESEQAWLSRIWNNVTEAEKVIETKTGRSLKYLAYPFGEYNEVLASRLTEHGYVGFGQHSGAAGPHSNQAAIPRFPAAGPYAKLDTLKTKLASLAMPVDAVSLVDPEIKGRKLDSPITVTLEEKASDNVRLKQLACYYQGSTLTTSQSENSFTFILDKQLPTGRSRVNCTAPSNKLAGRFYWYSMPFFVATEEGKYPD